MDFSCRYSSLAETREIVLSASFAKPYDAYKPDIKERINGIISSRRQRQPKNKKNCGSVFKRPLDGKPAGWYIDQAGLRGCQVGDAMIAHEHANWIVNLGNVKADDVKAIISHDQETVFHNFGIMLEHEIIYVPEDVL